MGLAAVQAGDVDEGLVVGALAVSAAAEIVASALAAAREGDDVNPERRSSRTQFYIVWGRAFDDEELDRMQSRIAAATRGRAVMPDSVREAYRTVGGTPHLDGQYTVFGRVVEGLETVEAIQRTPTDSLDRPATDVRILSARVER